MKDVSEGAWVGELQVVASAFELAGAGESGFLDEVLEIAGGGGARGAGDEDVFFRAESADETFGAFLEHAEKSFLLTLVQTAVMQVKEAGLGDEELHEELHEGLRVSLCFQNGLGEVEQPGGDFEAVIVLFQMGVVRLAGAIDDLRKGDEGWKAKPIR